MMDRANGMNAGMRGLCAASMLALGLVTAAQCPGIRPKFSWASNGSTLVFTDQTDAFVSERVWDFGDGDSAYEALQEHTYLLAGDDTVTMIVTVGGCTFSTRARVIHPGQSDACYSQLTSAFTAEQSGNNNMLFTDQSIGDGSFLFYLWTFGDDSISLLQNTTHFYALPGAYDVSHSIGTVDSLFQTACVAGSAEHVYVDGNTSTCDSSLFLDLAVEPNGNTVLCSAQAVLNNSDLMITYWDWDYGDGTPDDTTALPVAEHDYTYGGDFQICVQVWTVDTTSDDTCFARSCVSVSLPMLVGVNELLDREMLNARPVPFNAELWVGGDAVRRGARWRMIDALGRETRTGTVVHDGAEKLDTGALPNGLYTILLFDDQRALALRLVKQ